MIPDDLEPESPGGGTATATIPHDLVPETSATAARAPSSIPHDLVPDDLTPEQPDVRDFIAQHAHGTGVPSDVPPGQSVGQDIANVPGREAGRIARTLGGLQDLAGNLIAKPLMNAAESVNAAAGTPLPAGATAEAMKRGYGIGETFRAGGAAAIRRNPVERAAISGPADIAGGLVPLGVAGAVGGPGAAGAVMAGQLGGDVASNVYEASKAQGHTEEDARNLQSLAGTGGAAVGALTGPLFGGPGILAETGLQGFARAGLGAAVGAPVTSLATGAIENAATGQPMPTMRDVIHEAVTSALINMGVHGLTHSLPEMLSRPPIEQRANNPENTPNPIPAAAPEAPRPIEPIPTDLVPEQPRGLVGQPPGPIAQGSFEMEAGPRVEPFPVARDVPPDLVPEPSPRVQEPLPPDLVPEPAPPVPAASQRPMGVEPQQGATPTVPAQTTSEPAAQPENEPTAPRTPTASETPPTPVIEQPAAEPNATAARDEAISAPDARQTRAESAPGARFPDRTRAPAEISKPAFDQPQPLSNFADTLHSEQSADRVARWLNPKANIGTADTLYATNSPELATGQGQNKGVRLELDPAKLQGTVNTGKPGWEVQYDQGKAEFLADPAQARDAIRSITVDPETVGSREVRLIDSSARQAGLQRSVNDDGTIVYQRLAPEIAAAKQEALASVREQINKPVSEQEPSAQMRLVDRYQPEPIGPKDIGIAGGTEREPAAAFFGRDAKPDESKGSVFGTVNDKLTAAAYHLRDSAMRASGKMFPTITRLARGSGEQAARYVSSKVYAHEAGPLISQEVIGPKFSPEADKAVGAALVEDNLRSVRDDFLAEAKQANADAIKAKTPEERAAAVARFKESKDRAGSVGTLVGGKDSPFKSEAEFEAALKEHAPIIDRYKQWFSGEPEQNFKVSQGMSPEEELPTRGKNTEARVNMVAIKEEDPTTTGDRVVAYTSPQGNLRNPLLKNAPYARQAFGTGSAYEVRLSRMIENTLAKGTEIANWHRTVDQLVKDKLAVIGRPNDRPVIDGKPTRPIDLKRRTIITSAGAIPKNEVLHVRADVYPELRRAMNVDDPQRFETLRGAAKLANTAALASASEMTIHVGNQLSALVNTPGTGFVFPRLVKRAMDLIHNDPATNRQLVDLARMGALKEHGNRELTGLSRLNPMAHLMKQTGRLIAFTDKAGRLVLDDAFKALAAKGVVENTESNRRDLVNQFGQYNARAQHKLVAAARSTEIGPFATAGTNFYAMGMKAATLAPGMRATSMGNAIKLRGVVAARYATIIAGVALGNYLRWGRVDGGSGVPIGALKTGETDDGKSKYIDIIGLTPLRRGLREIGALAAIEGARRGDTGAAIVDRAARDMILSPVRPFEGPLVSAAAVGATGYDPQGYRVADRAPAGSSQTRENLKAMVKAANPIVETVTSDEGDPMSQLGKFAPRTARKPDEKPEERKLRLAKQDREVKRAQIKDALPNEIKKLVHEKDVLDAIGKDYRTPEQTKRQADLRTIEIHFTNYRSAAEQGDEKLAGEWRKMLDEDAKALSNSVD